MLELSDILKIVNALNARGVRFLLIGGVAMRLHGSNHLTDDLDICYARDADNLAGLAAAFAPYSPRLRGVPEDLPFIWDVRTLKNTSNLTLQTDIGDLDILGDVPGIDSFDGLLERSVEMQIHDMLIRVASIDDLIAMKKAANRPKDQVHVMELEALRKLLQMEEARPSEER